MCSSWSWVQQQKLLQLNARIKIHMYVYMYIYMNVGQCVNERCSGATKHSGHFGALLYWKQERSCRCHFMCSVSRWIWQSTRIQKVTTRHFLFLFCNFTWFFCFYYFGFCRKIAIKMTNCSKKYACNNNNILLKNWAKCDTSHKELLTLFVVIWLADHSNAGIYTYANMHKYIH